MNVYDSYALANKIMKKSGGSRNPDIICGCLGIEIEESYDLGNLKGMYSSANRHRTIFLNCRLTEYLRRIVLMHEIIHDQIPEHRRRAKALPYQDHGAPGKFEREANSVAAHILIDDDEMITLIQEGRTSQQIAAILKVPEDLLLIELEDYKKIHTDFNIVLPRCGDGSYLKKYGETDYENY